tara:strand:- start:210 stop:332 length:123 start_codon:yes stop_codon:yes gene_type:complete
MSEQQAKTKMNVRVLNNDIINTWLFFQHNGMQLRENEQQL